MKSIKICFLLLLLSWQVPAQGVKKSVWIQHMSTTLPVLFCESKQFFRQCYRVTAERCEQVAASATRVCLNKFSSQMPANFTGKQQAENWGKTVGECAGTTYHSVLSQEFIISSQCNDSSRWTK